MGVAVQTRPAGRKVISAPLHSSHTRYLLVRLALCTTSHVLVRSTTGLSRALCTPGLQRKACELPSIRTNVREGGGGCAAAASTLYDLHALVCHRGKFAGGHYVAYVKCDDGQW